MMLGSGNGTIGGMAAGVRADVGGDNTNWIAGEGWRQASTVLLYPQVRIDAYKGVGVTCQVENIIARIFLQSTEVRVKGNIGDCKGART